MNLHVYHRQITHDGESSLDKIARRINRPHSQVLDIGTGTGALGSYLQRTLACTVDGINYNAEEISLAQPFYRHIIQADLDGLALSPLINSWGKYDYIVCADILEHLRYPEALLAQLHQFLKPNGYLLISLPNIGYTGVINNLLMGKFCYDENGLLDRTHYRFFTRQSLVDLLSENNYEILDFDHVYVRLSQSEFHSHPLNLQADQLQRYLHAVPDGLAYQFIVEAKMQPQSSPITNDAWRKPMVAMEDRFLAGIFWASDSETFELDRYCNTTGILGKTDQTLIFDLPAMASSATRLRIEPSDRTGLLNITQIRLMDELGNCLLSLPEESARILNVDNLHIVENHQQGVWQIYAKQAFASLELATPFQARDKLKRVEMDVCWPRNDDSRAFTYIEIECEQQLHAAETTINKLQATIIDLTSDISAHLEQQNKLSSELEKTQTALRQTQTSLDLALLDSNRKNEALSRITTENSEHKLELSNLYREIDRLTAELESRNRSLLEIYNSTSWKIGKPMRAAARLLDAARHIQPRKKIQTTKKIILARHLSTLRRVYHQLPVSEEIRWKLRKAGQRLLGIHTIGELLIPAQGDTTQHNETPAVDQALDAATMRILLDLPSKDCIDSNITHFILLPFIANGGAEIAAAAFARAIADSGGKALIVVTDSTNLDGSHLFAGIAPVICFNEHLGQASYEKKCDLLGRLLAIFSPVSCHNINAEVGWKYIIERSQKDAPATSFFGSIFAMQYAQDKTPTGYAAYFLKKGLPHIQRLLTDNLRFIDNAREAFNLTPAEYKKIYSIYNPCRILGPEQHARAMSNIGKISNNISQIKRPRFLWAGRLDKEKRADILFDIALQCRNMDFIAYGQKVIDSESTFQELENLHFAGPFTNPIEMFSAGQEYAGFIFTSRWEGLPNILLEIGALGIPIIAPTVGGVGELVSEYTGYPLREDASSADYIGAINHILSNPEDCQRKALKMLELIEFRHTQSSFSEKLNLLDAYLQAES